MLIRKILLKGKTDTLVGTIETKGNRMIRLPAGVRCRALSVNGKISEIAEISETFALPMAQQGEIALGILAEKEGAFYFGGYALADETHTKWELYEYLEQQNATKNNARISPAAPSDLEASYQAKDCPQPHGARSDDSIETLVKTDHTNNNSSETLAETVRETVAESVPEADLAQTIASETDPRMEKSGGQDAARNAEAKLAEERSTDQNDTNEKEQTTKERLLQRISNEKISVPILEEAIQGSLWCKMQDEENGYLGAQCIEKKTHIFYAIKGARNCPPIENAAFFPSLADEEEGFFISEIE